MIRIAFFLSKMTVVDEKEEAEFEYNYLAFVEFLEFVARVAHLFFADTP